MVDTGIDIETRPKSPRAGRGLLLFVIGLVVGIVAAIVARPFLGERLPEAVGGKRESVQGPVTAKQQQENRLLLTINTPAGAILGTFSKKIDEINLLVETGDTVTLTIPGYQPFLNDPEITRVAKSTGRPGAQPPEPKISEPAATDSLGLPADSLQKADSASSEPASRWY
jgi:hypothetical protein